MMKKFQPVLTKFAGTLRYFKYWHVLLCGKNVSVAYRQGHSRRLKGDLHTSNYPAIYVFFPTGASYNDNKHLVVHTGRADNLKCMEIGALWAQFDAAGRMPTQEEIEILL